MSMIRITSNSKQYLAALAAIPKAMQEVTAQTLTDTARAVTIRGERNIKKEMIVRTPYTTKSLRTFKASPSRPIERQDAVSGAVSPYLPIQDEGGTIKARKQRIAVPTNRVRGKDRKRKVSGRYKIEAMKGKSFVMGPGKLRTRAGLFIRTGKKGKIVKVRDLGEQSFKLKARRWHTEAVEKYGNYEFMARQFAKNARHFLKNYL